MLLDLPLTAILTGDKLMSEYLRMKLESMIIAYHGQAKHITVKTGKMMIVQRNGAHGDIGAKIKLICRQSKTSLATLAGKKCSNR
jgi:hypothetical protein